MRGSGAPTPHLRRRLAGLIPAAALFVACAQESAGVRPSRPPSIPPGCQRDLSGAYVHALDPSFHYLAQDDGGTLVLYVRREGPDGGIQGAPDPGRTRVVLTRGDKGFAGQTVSTQLNAAHAACPVSLATAVTQCAHGQITLRTLDRTAIDESCHAPANGPAAAWVEERLLSAPTRPTPDAGR